MQSDCNLLKAIYKYSCVKTRLRVESDNSNKENSGAIFRFGKIFLNVDVFLVEAVLLCILLLCVFYPIVVANSSVSLKKHIRTLIWRYGVVDMLAVNVVAFGAASLGSISIPEPVNEQCC